MSYISNYPIIIFDFETTGFDPVTDEIIQIAFFHQRMIQIILMNI